MPCLYPRTVRIEKKNGEKKCLVVPCGKCYKCQERKSLEYSFRLFQDVQHCTESYFVTLTYEDSFLSFASQEIENPDTGELTVKVQPCLVKSDLQNFFKRLRTNHVRSTDERAVLKYFACGEYGHNYHRPHYHFILLNFGVYRGVDFWIASIESAWTLGFSEIKDVNENNIHYVAGYTTEKLLEDQDYMNTRTGFVPIVPEFRLLSSGLGASYVEDYNSYHHGHLDRFYCNYNGHKIAMPRYYRDKLYTPSEQRVYGKHVLSIYDKLDEKIPINDHDAYVKYMKRCEASNREFIRRKREKIIKRKSH